ncbi:hypothetical protein C0Q70_06173 [Pomacea canaliculata]|uniref:COMM domain-containing protein n=1 Tax=Pomacea canaliculata TaxID=400727 RepID=A0A2T7PNB7_POMCA|nr:hypothetical protein C0Q70_06173 [Pomacea canaliculata]
MMAETEWEAVAVILSKLSAAEINKLSHIIAEQITFNKVPSSEACMKKLSNEEWCHVTRLLSKFYKTAIKQALSEEQIQECLHQLPEEQKTAIKNAISTHRQDLRLSLLDDTTAVSQCVLKDFDWQLKLVMSSDKLSSVNEPLLNVDLNLQDGTGSFEQVAVELDQADLKKFLASLEACSKVSND